MVVRRDSGPSAASPRRLSGKSAPVKTDPQQDERVAHLLKLLQVRGARGAEEMRSKISSGKSICVRGISFDICTMEEALRRWTKEQEAASSTAAEPPKIPTTTSTSSGGLPSSVPKGQCRVASEDFLAGLDGTGGLLYEDLLARLASGVPGRKRGRTSTVPAAKRPRCSAAELPTQLPQALRRTSASGREPTVHGTRLPNSANSTVSVCGASINGVGTASAPQGPAAEATEKEVKRILQLNKSRYVDHAAWGFAVLAISQESASPASVQSAYRTMMRKLHPDKVGQMPDVERAVEFLRSAKELCERALLRQKPPGKPQNLTSSTICSVPGSRSFRLQWRVPVSSDAAPVQRFVVAAFDPAYGKALTITVLEPDYDEERRRWVSVDELNSFVLAEKELPKMPSLFKQAKATVQVAAANDAGQSEWSTLQIPMTPEASPPQLRRSSVEPIQPRRRLRTKKGGA
eukprot:gnl/TRDRNA2_/TRDRNA2_80356_c0_seq1.p1 gnl/TRDRNA2_/TRDRNA2_80356_c0~~gnl/TRDRNA2_/TRDRNA2_80356_c0_seq1.p1  ORF type:complete len:461 (+),score=75.28 gnl/TRDRNA2_/TRDRNA2_80356_c0_seq1:68-1450(+)